MSEYLPLPEGFFVVWRIGHPDNPSDETKARYVRADPADPDPAGAIGKVFPELAGSGVHVFGQRWFTPRPTNRQGTVEPRGAHFPGLPVDDLDPVELWHSSAPLWAGDWERWEEFEPEDRVCLTRSRFYAMTPGALYERAVELAEAYTAGGLESYDRLTAIAPNGETVTAPVYGRRVVPGWTSRGPEPIAVRVTIPPRRGPGPESERRRCYMLQAEGLPQLPLVHVHYCGGVLAGAPQEALLTPLEADAELRQVLTPGHSFNLYQGDARGAGAARGVVR